MHVINVGTGLALCGAPKPWSFVKHACARSFYHPTTESCMQESCPANGIDGFDADRAGLVLDAGDGGRVRHQVRAPLFQ